MKYLDYALANGHKVSDINNMVSCLFGINAEMNFLKKTKDHVSYDMGNGYILYSNSSSFDTVELLENDVVIESWCIEY